MQNYNALPINLEIYLHHSHPDQSLHSRLQNV